VHSKGLQYPDDTPVVLSPLRAPPTVVPSFRDLQDRTKRQGQYSIEDFDEEYDEST
jgi:hypothetical protein